MPLAISFLDIIPARMLYKVRLQNRRVSVVSVVCKAEKKKSHNRNGARWHWGSCSVAPIFGSIPEGCKKGATTVMEVVGKNSIGTIVMEEEEEEEAGGTWVSVVWRHSSAVVWNGPVLRRKFPLLLT